MHRDASDNEYLHRDFHGALSAGIEYLHEHYGDQAVREYLRQFANVYYAPLKQAIRARGLSAIAEHYRTVYQAEGGDVECRCDDNTLTVRTTCSPAVTHMRDHGYAVARLFRETIGTVNEALCDGTAFSAELAEYDDRTGAAVMRFRRGN